VRSREETALPVTRINPFIVAGSTLEIINETIPDTRRSCAFGISIREGSKQQGATFA
jgi:hypothetical protein